ncbi:MAG: permease [Planctomycetota bacterium]|jgi:uncharacterized membrane protein YraQ (UPF0718 family)|nr:permease [Planctomycetota bacterium]
MTTRGKGNSPAQSTAAGPSRCGVFTGLALAIVCAAYLLPFFAGGNETVGNFSLVFSSIMLEAMPFMLLGALIGGMIEVFVSRERIASLLPGRDWASACVAAALGALFPVCECAIVPVVRRLAGKGLPAAAAIAYLLAGPIVNPVVGLSTAMAYNFDWRPVAIRLGFGYAIAVGVALILNWRFSHGSLFVGGIARKEGGHAHDGHSRRHGGRSNQCGPERFHNGKSGHDHVHDGGHTQEMPGCGYENGQSQGGGFGARAMAAGNHALDDFMATAPYLVAGAAIAAIAQTCLERRLFVEMAASSMLSSAVMMLLAVLLNLCSEADAFIAASFRGLVPFSAQMAFLVVGPMFDIKLLLMYRNFLKARATAFLAALVVVAVMLMSLLLEVAGVAL